MSFTIAGTALGVTIEQWCDRVLRDHLGRNETEQLEKLNGAVTTGATSIVTTYGAKIRPQTRVELGNELLHVWQESTTDTYTVERGMGGTTAVNHDDGDLVRIAPRFPKIVLASQLRQEIRSWPSPIVAIASADFSLANGVEVFDLDGLEDVEGLRLLGVQHDHERTSNDAWPFVPNARLETRQNATDFASGVALHLGGYKHSGGRFRVTVGYRHPTSQDSIDFADDLGETFHLNGSLADIAMLGVAGTLLLGDEIDRTNDLSQGRPRRAEDVPPGHRLQAGQGLLQMRDILLKLEAERTYSDFAPRFQ